MGYEKGWFIMVLRLCIMLIMFVIRYVICVIIVNLNVIERNFVVLIVLYMGYFVCI